LDTTALVDFGHRLHPDAILTGMKKPPTTARRWLIHGRVQGVGFRYFVERAARQLELTGYARNLDDGQVEVYAAGPAEKIAELAGLLRVGPRWADVRGVDEQEAAMQEHEGFDIR
jgi:acylphosphatase